jgi:hypothetical protein
LEKPAARLTVNSHAMKKPKPKNATKRPKMSLRLLYCEVLKLREMVQEAERKRAS